MVQTFTMRSADDGARFELGRHNDNHLIAHIAGLGLNASVLVSSYMFDGFAEFFESLARDWKGWKGERGWGSLEGELGLRATADQMGHVYLSIEIRDGAPPRWQTTASFVLEAGARERIARSGREFEQSITSAA